MANAASGLTVRRYDDPADDPRLLQLLEEAFGGWPAGGAADAAAHLRWKLHSRPEAARSHVVAEIDGRIVGAVFYLVQEVKVGDRLLHARQGIDACISPGYRKRGVMAEIRRFSWELDVGSFDLQFGPTGHRAVIRLDDREGAARFAEHVDVLRHPLERSSPADDAQPGAGERPGWTIGVASRFDERIDEFWTEASQPFDFIVVRTKDYLNWRYCDARAGTFTILLAEQDDRILGYAAVCVRRGTGRIADLLALPDRSDIARSLIGAAVDHLRAAGASSVECWTTKHHAYRGLLKRGGFTVRQRSTRLTYGPMREPAATFEFLGRPGAAVHFLAGDSDLV